MMQLNDGLVKSHKRIILEVSEAFHHEVKMRALSKNMSIKEWVYLSLKETIRREKLHEKDKQNS